MVFAAPCVNILDMKLEGQETLENDLPSEGLDKEDIKPKEEIKEERDGIFKVENDNKSDSNPFEESFSFNNKAEEYFETEEALENKKDLPRTDVSMLEEQNTHPLSLLDQELLPDGLKREDSQETNTRPFTFLDQELNKLKAPDATGFSKSGFQCLYCDRKFKGSKQWKNHIRAKHTGETPYHCSMCDKKYCSYSSLSSHLLTHGEKTHKCDSCPEAFFQKGQLKVHKELNHSGPLLKKFHCVECGLKLRTKLTLDMHVLRKHKGIRSHMCDLCGHSFKTKGDLKRHHDSKHNQDGPTYGPCSICGMNGFSRPDNLREHELRHSKSRDYKCEKCGKGFATKEYLRIHLKRHESPKAFEYSCRFCDKKFPQSSTRNNHELVHTGEKPYHCSMCDYKCNNNSNLRKHMKLKHGENSTTRVKRLAPGHSSKTKVIAISTKKSEVTVAAPAFISSSTKVAETEKDSHFSSISDIGSAISNTTSELSSDTDNCLKAKIDLHQNNKTEGKKDLGNRLSSNDNLKCKKETDLSTKGDSKPSLEDKLGEIANTSDPHQVKSGLIPGPRLLNESETLKTEDINEYNHSTEDLNEESQGVSVKVDQSVKEEAVGYIEENNFVVENENIILEIDQPKEGHIEGEGTYQLRPTKKRLRKLQKINKQENTEPKSLLDEELLKLKACAPSGYRQSGFQCTFCEKKFNRSQAWKAHMRAHTQERPYSCSKCDKTFRTNSGLSAHSKTHGEKTHICDSCPKAFFQKVQLKIHREEHHGAPVSKPFSCDKCDLKFRARSGLENHLIRHNDIRAHICDLCGYKCKTSSDLKRHRIERCKQNKDRETFGPCSICGKNGFSRPEALQAHESRHSGARDFKCATCNKGFKTEGDLKTHLPMHTDPTYRKVQKYPCSHCGKMFTQPGARQIHERIHTGEKPFKCSVCDFRCVSSSNLGKHMKMHGN